MLKLCVHTIDIEQICLCYDQGLSTPVESPCYDYLKDAKLCCKNLQLNAYNQCTDHCKFNDTHRGVQIFFFSSKTGGSSSKTQLTDSPSNFFRKYLIRKNGLLIRKKMRIATVWTPLTQNNLLLSYGQ